jgi:hypothetical protein
MQIDFLNHASVIISHKETRLLIDPWFWGTCFDGGWGLRFDNPEAIHKAGNCTHLWVSHPHQDHLHKPTLQKILELNPAIQFIGNNSYNFQLDKTAQSLGFKNVTPLYERKTIKLSDDFSITRYPTTGIDNMLLIKTPQATVLNFNDCNIPALSKKMLKKKFGDIDMMLCNFNHAGKLFLYPFPDPAVIKRKLVENFKENIQPFQPKYILPFASYHYYRSPESLKQNDAMLGIDDLAPLESRIIAWKTGDSISYNGKAIVKNGSAHVVANKMDINQYKEKYSISDIENAGKVYSDFLKKRFGLLKSMAPPLYIKIADLEDTVIGFKPGKGVFHPVKPQAPHIRTWSEPLYNWFSRPFGTDSFVVGAHFDIINENRVPLKWQVILGLLTENKLDARSVLAMLFRKGGLKFFYNRREEILGIMTSFRLAATYHKD